jgi:hypothetical protein
MNGRRVVAALGAAAVLTLVAWVCVVAQTPRSRGSTVPPAPPPGTRYSIPAADIRPSTTPYSPSINFPVVPAVGTQPYSQTFTPQPAGTPIASLPVKLELTSGLALAGQVAAEPLACQAAFGDIMIPLDTIRGLRLHDVPSAAEPEKQRPAAQATVVLNNHDSLTVTLRAAQIQVKTEWGMAFVDVSHLRSLVLTTDEVKWQETGGRWNLVPVEKPPAEASEAPAEAEPAPASGIITPRIIIQEEAEEKLGTELP